MPDSMFVSAGALRAHRCRRVPAATPSRRRSRSSFRRRRSAQPRPLDRRVDTNRPALTRGWHVATRSRPGGVSRALLRVPARRRSSSAASPPAAGSRFPPGRPSCSGSRPGRRRRRPLLTLAAGLPLAWVDRTIPVPRPRARARLVLVPFVLPTVVVATAFLALSSRRATSAASGRSSPRTSSSTSPS